MTLLRALELILELAIENLAPELLVERRLEQEKAVIAVQKLIRLIRGKTR